MLITPIRTRKLIPPKDDLFALLDESLKDLRERDILLVASKIVAIHQGKCVRVEDADYTELIKQEADKYFPPANKKSPPVTLMENTFVARAGIDENNGNGFYILWPEEPTKAAKEIAKHLKKKHELKNLAVLIVDSHSTPLRGGSIGVSIGGSGIEPLIELKEKKDIFGRPASYKSNVVDAIAAAGVLNMGETNEQTPLCIVRDLPESVVFTDKDVYHTVFVKPEHDMYQSVMKGLYEE